MNEELKVIISAEVKKLKDGVKDAKKSIKDFTKDAKKKVEEFNAEFSKVGDVAKRALAISAGAVVGMAGALLSLSGSTAEYRTAQAKLNTAFETAGSSAAVAKQTYNDLYRVLGDGDVAVEAANHLAKLTTNEKDLSQWTNICQGVYATFGDSLPIEGLTEAANETAKVGTLTGSLADALNWAGVNEDAFNEKLAACNTEAEREKLIRETLNGLYSDAAATYEANAASLLAQNEAQAKLDESLARIGETLQPVNTALTTLAADILAQLTPYIQEFIDKYLPNIISALKDVGTKIGEVISWIADNWELVSSIAGIILTIIAVLATLSTIVSVVSTVLTIATSPIMLVVAGIVALVAIVVLCIFYWDEIKAKVLEVVENIKEWVLDMVEKVKQWFNEMREKMGDAIDKAKTAITDKFKEIKENIKTKVIEAKDEVVKKFEEIKQKITDKLTEAKTAVVDKFTEIKQNISDKVSGAAGSVKEWFGSIGSTVLSKASEAASNAKSFFGDIYNNITSKVSGAATTVANKFKEIKESITSKIQEAKDMVSGVIENLKDMFDMSGVGFKMPNIKLPHFSISGSFSLSPLKVPKIKVSWYEMGGVFDSPTLFGYGNGMLGGLGENGAEAVVPLEKNTKWLDKIADKLAAKQTSTPIVLTVDGKVFAQTTINSINQLTRQTGHLGLNLV